VVLLALAPTRPFNAFVYEFASLLTASKQTYLLYNIKNILRYANLI